ncbi:MAG: phosphatidylserine decarboxylase [Fusobacterium sp. JB021]|nr:phosphatidylserine decarboxylase [Fusobacterium sp. JB021]MDP0505706.1 phosphatidylserine decarboxylase [Fusobacterium sp. JB019]
MKFEKIKYKNRITDEILTEEVPGEHFLKFLYYNPFGKLALNLVVKRKFLSSLYGKKMDSKKSVNLIKEFVENYNINMNESIKQVDEFNSFNDFFIRKLKPEARKIDFSKNTLVSPSDGKIFALERINDSSKFFLKGDEFSLGEFFKDDKLAKKYFSGTMLIIRLAPVDYHRYHFPCDGKILPSKLIKGNYFSVSPHAIRQNFRIFCENKREFSILKSKNFGDICIAEIGATMVGGIVQSYKSNSLVKKGDEKGYFYFGGSTVILLIEKNKVIIDEDILENSKKGLETQIKMGEKIGINI